MNRYLDLFTIIVVAVPSVLSNFHRRSVRDVLYRQLVYTFVDGLAITAVSYTHLTLPTIYSV